MIVGVLELELYLAGSTNLKDKRRVIKSLIVQIHNRFHVAVAEVGELDKWQHSVLGIACVSREKRQVNLVLNKVQAFVEENYRVEIISACQELL